VEIRSLGGYLVHALSAAPPVSGGSCEPRPQPTPNVDSARLLLALTGTSGFLGRHLASAARAAGHAVRGLVAPGYPSTEGVENVTGDLGDPEAIRALVAGADVLVHLAAVGVQARDRSWERMALVNVVQPLALLEAAADAKVKRAVLAGTCLEYTGHGRLPEAPAAGAPLCDEASPLDPADPYGATKAAGGVLQRARARELRLPTWYLRLASMYGPGDDPAKLCPGAARAAGAREPFDITGGEQVREWLHVSDGARALLAAAEAEPPEPVATLNVGTGEGVRLLDVVRTVYGIAGADASLVRAGARPYRAREVHRIVMDVSRAERALGGWRPRVDLRQGLEALVREAAGAGGRK